MAAMPESPARYRVVLGVGWLLLAAAAWIYSSAKAIPASVAMPLAAAFLVEFAFYLLPTFPNLWRCGVGQMGRTGTVAFLTIAGIIPYLVYSLPTGLFSTINLATLTAIALSVSLVYARGRVSAPRDALFVALLAGFILYRFFDRIYPTPLPKVPMSILGHVMLIRTAALALYGLRGNMASRFAFLPAVSEWISGLKWFILSLVPLAAMGAATGAVRIREHALSPATALATFFGILWVVALSEEFFFRGLLQQWFEDGTSSRTTALVAASLLFGSVHLGFHGAFPNWRFSLVAAVLGLFCGLAWREKRSVQTSMVTHALAATAFRVFFQ
jgi:membrane protease YdiL (CAAX protease family)